MRVRVIALATLCAALSTVPAAAQQEPRVTPAGFRVEPVGFEIGVSKAEPGFQGPLGSALSPAPSRARRTGWRGR